MNRRGLLCRTDRASWGIIVRRGSSLRDTVRCEAFRLIGERDSFTATACDAIPGLVLPDDLADRLASEMEDSALHGIRECTAFAVRSMIRTTEMSKTILDYENSRLRPQGSVEFGALQAGDTVPDSSELLKYLEESAPQLSAAESAALDLDAVWALNAWANRRSTPECQIHLGKYVAVFGQKVVCSGSDEQEVKARAAEMEGVSAERIFTDYWEEDTDIFHSLMGE